MKRYTFKIMLVMAAVFMSLTAGAQSGYEVYKSNGEKVIYQYNEIDSIVFKADLNIAVEGMISDVSVTKTSISYKINVKDNETYRHTYIEAWYYDYMMDLYKQQLGQEFDKDVVVCNLLADYGHEATGSKDVTWTAGDENIARNDIVRLVGGKDYYIIANYYDPETANWLGVPAVKRVTMDAAGKSAANVDIELLEQEPTSVLVCMHPGADVNFYFYDFYKKSAYDENIAKNGQEWMENFLFEYAYTSNVEYTDRWSTDPDTEYVLALLGVDKNGDTFFVSKDIVTPAVKEQLVVKMEPYDRPDENRFDHESLKIDVDATSIKNMYGDAVMEVFMPTATLNATLEMMGMNMDMLRQAPEYVSYIGATPLPQEEANELLVNNKFTSVRGELEAETEYTYLILIPAESGYFLGEAHATTAAEATTTDPEPEYKAFLGEWTVKGTTTEDYSSQLTYDIRIEQDVVNNSFKIYGWGNADMIKDKAFTARYDSNTKKMYIDGNQDIGNIVLDGSDFALRFCGMVMQNGDVQPVDYNGVIYEAKCNGDHMSLFPNFVNNYEIASMGFFGETSGVYVAIPGDEYNMVSFTVDKKK